MPERYTYDLPVNIELKKPHTAVEDITYDPWASDEIKVQSRRTPQDANLSRRAFELLNAQRFIDEVGVWKDEGELDIHATAKNVGVPVKYDESLMFRAKGTLGGYGPFKGKSERLLSLQPKLGRDETVTFAHEIGHLFLGEVVPNNQRLDIPGRVEEEFCDYFGRAMAMPEKLIERYDTSHVDEQKIIDLALGFKVLVRTAVLQCIEKGSLPDKVSIDTYIYTCPNPDYSEMVERVCVCLHCEETSGDLYCPNAGKESRLLDFTEYAWAWEFGRCQGEERLSLDERKKLTAYYESLPRQIPLFFFDPLGEWKRSE